MASQLAWREALRPTTGATGPAPRGWIVPLASVAAAPLRDRDFDVVVVDEADRLGPEALALLWPGRRVVLVGGDRRIPHDDGNVPAAVVAEYRDRYLARVPDRMPLGPEHTLFDLVSSRHEGALRLEDRGPVAEPPPVAWRPAEPEPEPEPEPVPAPVPVAVPAPAPEHGFAEVAEPVVAPVGEPIATAPAEPEPAIDPPAPEALMEPERGPGPEPDGPSPGPEPRDPAPTVTAGVEDPMDRVADLIGTACRSVSGILGSFADGLERVRRGIGR